MGEGQGRARRSAIFQPTAVDRWRAASATIATRWAAVDGLDVTIRPPFEERAAGVITIEWEHRIT